MNKRQIIPNYYARHSDLVSLEELNVPILVIGAGGIGGWTALCLSKMGCQNLTLIDKDTVGEENVGNQIYSSRTIGVNKTVAWGQLTESLRDMDVVLHHGEFTNLLLLEKAFVISAVDNMETRRAAFESLTEGQIFIDGRMAGNALEVYTVTPERREQYVKTLFTDEEGVELPCTARTIIYNCFIISGLIADAVVRTIKKDPVPFVVEIDLRNYSFFTG